MEEGEVGFEDFVEEGVGEVVEGAAGEEEGGDLRAEGELGLREFGFGVAAGEGGDLEREFQNHGKELGRELGEVSGRGGGIWRI